MAPQTSIFPQWQENTAVMEGIFPVWSMQECYKQDQLAVTVSLKTAGVQSLAVAVRNW